MRFRLVPTKQVISIIEAGGLTQRNLSEFRPTSLSLKSHPPMTARPLLQTEATECG